MEPIQRRVVPWWWGGRGGENRSFPPAVTERAGFEPATHLSAGTRFPVALLQPLGHLSGWDEGKGTGLGLLRQEGDEVVDLRAEGRERRHDAFRIARHRVRAGVGDRLVGVLLERAPVRLLRVG